jgi:hypothetical protein
MQAETSAKGVPVTLFQKKTQLLKRKRELDTQIAIYRRHLEQYECQRKYADELQTNLKPGEAILMRDFVNSYNYKGKHVKNLVFVLLYREKEGGPLQELNLSNLCSDADTQQCDRFFYRDVLLFHLHATDDHHTGILNQFKHIYVVGDHGMHFCSQSTFWLHSTLFEEFGITFEDVFLCSYHAYNRCDGAGARVTRLGEAWRRTTEAPSTRPNSQPR